MPRNRRMENVLSKLKKAYPNAQVFLSFRTPWELLVATQLSAQCTDARVNLVTKTLFEKYPALDDYVRADPREFEKDVFSTGFYRNKTRNILAAARMVKKEFGGVVPNSMDGLLRLPGVARKTANVVLSQGFGIQEGIAVDTHVARIAQRLGWTAQSAPKKIEHALMGWVPPGEYHWLSTALILHGRRVCFARKPDCAHCFLHRVCPSAFRAGNKK